MNRPLKVMVCAVEPSGDALGGALMAALSARAPGISFSGCGGPAMKARGLDSLFDIGAFSVMGPVAALKALPAAQNGARDLANHAVQEDVDAAVLIDSWAFSKLAAERIRKASPRTALIKYVAPQVWASRPKRAETLAQIFDSLITLFEFETPWFENHSVRTVCAGHSGFQELTRTRGGGAAFREKHQIGDAPLVILAPGSRRGEIRQLAERFRAAIDIARADSPALKIAIPVAPGRGDDIRDAFEGWDVAPLLVAADEKPAAFDAADAGLVASGTLSTELAICGTPMVVAYRFGPITAAWGRSVVTSKWASLINIAAQADIIPEFIQEKCEPSALATALQQLLTDADVRAGQLNAFPAALEKLGTGGAPAAETAADAILSWIND